MRAEACTIFNTIVANAERQFLTKLLRICFLFLFFFLILINFKRKLSTFQTELLEVTGTLKI